MGSMGRDSNHKVGVWLITCLMEVTGWRGASSQAGRKTKRSLATPEFLSHRDTILAAAEALAFCQWPMLCPPVDWANDTKGATSWSPLKSESPDSQGQSIGPLSKGTYLWPC